MSSSRETVELSAQLEDQHIGQRMDQVLAELFPDYSRSRIKDWILAGGVKIDGQVVDKPRTKMLGNESIEVTGFIEVHSAHQAQDIELPIIYEDDDILILNKPVGMVVHPGAGNHDNTLLNAMLNHCPGIDIVPRAGIVHRLDKDTTGLMVVAKTIPAHTHLVAELQAREITREYEAIVNGVMVAGGTVDAAIGRHQTKRTSMAVRHDGKPSVTHYRIIEKFADFTHLRLKLESGRTHQIRVHMSHIRHPLVGDPMYGGRMRLPKGASPELVETLRGFNRQALHAVKLGLFHPTSGEWMTWEAPLPEDFVKLRNTLRKQSPLI
ncbi:23S rRNA pseudouridine(1911/1915/1917) synthase RluD [Paraneptunicella aestuarii]|uniref:23S rRNA pseudouridine(1911/1915/1917) synthase RluD n=1 Tax=Paraneptunicella aestuarii TaxID=2831148 RepID=UPI001E543A23|nr:23S rRNA pseudouridine(1911/1915/1917) synthase RluD [Paraneptunicella aestuarii]UAA39958.1 23S rRNA pseudouridine(1911/1915/1917) synthase RluD [Paraneptunicella aestuarii]